jgi:hypothetical protein
MRPRLVGGLVAVLLAGAGAYAGVRIAASGSSDADGPGGDDEVATAGAEGAGGDSSRPSPSSTEPPAPSTTLPLTRAEVCLRVVDISDDMMNTEFDLRDKGADEVFRVPKPIEQSSAELDQVNRNAFVESRRTGAAQIRSLPAANPAQRTLLDDFANELDRAAQMVADGALTDSEGSDQQWEAYNHLVLSGGCDPGP